MAPTPDDGRRTLPPDDAFAVLGNESRMGILQELAEADGPLSFSELRERVGVRDSGQFNYHLDKLAGHFVVKTDSGYVIRKPGRRVIEAVLSGAVTDAVDMGPTRLDAPCPYCGAAIEISYREERLLIRCTECIGSFGDIDSTTAAIQTLPEGTLSLNHLPSAGFLARTPQGLLEAALTWTYHRFSLFANDICPQCSGVVEHSVEVCESHDSEGICNTCQTRWAVLHNDHCTNCGHLHRGGFSHHLLGEGRVRSFFQRHGIDPMAPAYENIGPFYNYEENVISSEPFEAQFTFTVGGDELVVSVDDNLSVTELMERNGSQSTS